MRDRRRRNILIGSLFAVLVFMGIGYAIVSQILNISGVSSVNGKWNIYIESITPAASGSGNSVKAEVGLDKLSATFEAELIKPGDVVEYTVVVKNGGNIAARLEQISPTVTNPHEYVKYTNDLELHTILQAGESMSFKVRTEFVSSITNIDENLTVRPIYNLVLNFIQYDSDNQGGGTVPTEPQGTVLARGDISGSSSQTDDVYWEYYSNGILKFSGTGNMKEQLRTELTNVSTNSDKNDFYDIQISTQIIAQIVHNHSLDTGTEITYDEIYDVASGGYIDISDQYSMLQMFLFSESYIQKVFQEEGMPFNSIDDYIAAMAASGEIPQETIDSFAVYREIIPQISGLIIEDGITSIAGNAFNNFGYSGSIEIPEGITSIGDYAFRSNAITSINFPEGLVSIGDCAFEDNQLQSVTLPSTLTSIGYEVFSNNPITSVTINGDSTRFNNDWMYTGFDSSLKPTA